MAELRLQCVTQGESLSGGNRERSWTHDATLGELKSSVCSVFQEELDFFFLYINPVQNSSK